MEREEIIALPLPVYENRTILLALQIAQNRKLYHI